MLITMKRVVLPKTGDQFIANDKICDITGKTKEWDNINILLISNCISY